MRHFNGKRAVRALGLFVLLSAVYFLTYSGQYTSTDEIKLFDAAHSFAHFGTLDLDYTHTLLGYSTLPGNQIVKGLDSEPMQVYAADPLLWLADHLPGVGQMQTAWLLNILVTAATAVVLFYYGVALGYPEFSALVVGLIFGVATIAWPYTQLFFREPLFTLMVILCALGLENWRQRLDQRKFHSGWLLVAILALVVALLTKEAGILIIPTLLVIALPGIGRRLVSRRVFAGLIALIFLIILFVLIFQIAFPGTRYNILDRLDRLRTLDFSVLRDALPAYFISPGLSLWAFSPVLLLSLAGIVRWWREGKHRQSLVVVVTLVIFPVGYGLFQSGFWYGGLGWGPRFLVPMTPFLSLGLLPIADRLLARRSRLSVQAAAVGLVIQSMFVQIVAVLLPTRTFSGYLYQESVRLYPDIQPYGTVIKPWQDGTWNPLYIPQIVNAHLSGSIPSPFAWDVNHVGIIIFPLFLITALLAFFVLSGRLSPGRRCWLFTVGTVLSLIVFLFVGLRLYYRDPRISGDNPALWTVLDHLNTDVGPDDAILLNNQSYLSFFMNYYKGNAPIYVLPDAPGEHPEPGSPPEIETNNLDEQAPPFIPMMLARLAPQKTRWWFFTEFTPFSPGRLRPTEHYLVRHYFPAGEVVNEPNARLIIFEATDAPSDSIPPWPDNPVNANYGPAVLVGFDLPRGNSIQPGTMYPISLLWRHDGWPADMPPFDYGVNVALINKDGVNVAQNAGTPIGTFGTMSGWVKGGYYRDNRALILPANLPAGDYELWALIYDWRDAKNLPVRDANGVQIGDHVMLAKIHVVRAE